MTRKLLTTVAAGALFATAFAPAAFSQSTTQPADPNAPATQAAPGDPAAPPKVPDATAPVPAGDAAQAPAPAETTDTAQAGGGAYLTEQAADQVSANTYIGQSVYNSQNESIGSVNDLIMKKDGGLVAAIVGVGGFLGIGEKNVAVPMDKITVAQNTQDGSVKLTTSETAESLNAAPQFKTLQMLAAEKAPALGGTTDTTATGSTTNN
ncbi:MULTISPECIES: PRC-barrel domain-containing protein [unclassified Rhizobium]|uniref:PRC-barrel domain-containing protein n=1 Tax=unclassified Rhizobium TaxID=2613769 RepID=UPI001045AAA3|nr:MULTISPECIES: PRC-barrel domain-containing protein [unclassified Rhizobium]MBB3394086.1 sporulation protein YlmC with PRC-barrel domain [Rhizobium sp. BK060]MBB4168171.1 sporulation protein YlmC with PRC-barrel domain [Rhizobium sp. BK538]TCM80768.1 sporulation protein YlmC with PRC-barrel domain [Rhizobium sp. BK068]